MKRLTLGQVLSVLLVLSGAAVAEQDKAEQPFPLRLELALADGSRVIGLTRIETVLVQTAYAKMDVALRQIRTIKMADDHEMAAIDLRNGDRINGVVSLKPIEMETVFGKVAIGIEHVRELNVAAEAGTLPESLRKGLVLHYSFGRDCGARIVDDSGNGHAGTIKDAVWTAEGKQGGAYVFDGKDDRIDVSGWQPTMGKQPFSVAAWFRTEGGGSSREYRVLSWGVHRSWGGAEAGIAYQEKYFQFTTFGDGTTYLRGKANVCDNEWHSFVGTYDGTMGSLYIDGQLQERKDWSPVAIGSGDLGIAHRPPVGGSFWGGSIDEVMIYNRALSADEIQSLYGLQNQDKP